MQLEKHPVLPAREELTTTAINVRISVAIALLLLGACCERMETFENIYPDYQAAIDAGGVKRGWVPSFLPSSAKDIREKHDLDTNQVWLRFSLPDGGLDPINNSCRPANHITVSLPRKTAGDWWPDALVKTSAAQPRLGDYVYYKCDSGSWIAAALKSHEVYYWTA